MTVIVTGASGGIGFGIAKALVERGHTVYSFSRSIPSDARIKHIGCDVTNKESVESAFIQFFAAEKRLDILVNNAGIGISGATEMTDERDMKKIFDTNVFGGVYCAQCAVAKMREQKCGKIVFISSVGAVFTLPFQTFYSATKCAVNAVAEGLGMEVKPFGIKVGLILPGDIKSNFTANRKKDTTGEDVYHARIEKSVAAMERDELRGCSADEAGKQIAKYLCKKKLKVRKVLGAKYRFLCFLDRILPRRVVLALLYMMYGGA